MAEFRRMHSTDREQSLRSLTINGSHGKRSTPQRRCASRHRRLWSAMFATVPTGTERNRTMTGTLYRGVRVLACAFALLVCVAAWAASAASASDSIYWTSYTTAGAVRVGDLGGSGARDLFAGETNPQGVAIDSAAGKIYWADASGAIRVANLDGTGARNLYTGENTPSGVAIDPAAGLIYWADAVSGSGAIRVGNLDGSGARTLFAGED